MSFLHWLTLTGILMAAGLVLAAIRCALDYIGWWPMDYSDLDGRRRQ